MAQERTGGNIGELVNRGSENSPALLQKILGIIRPSAKKTNPERRTGNDHTNSTRQPGAPQIPRSRPGCGRSVPAAASTNAGKPSLMVVALAFSGSNIMQNRTESSGSLLCASSETALQEQPRRKHRKRKREHDQHLLHRNRSECSQPVRNCPGSSLFRWTAGNGVPAAADLRSHAGASPSSPRSRSRVLVSYSARRSGVGRGIGDQRIAVQSNSTP